jgi:hypothetical protein
MLKFFVLDVSLRRAWSRCRPIQLQTVRLHHPSAVDRPASYRNSMVRGPLLCRQANTVDQLPLVVPRTRLARGIARLIGTPAPVVNACVDAVDETIREPRPSHGMSTMQHAGRAFCVTAVLVTHAIGWARFARASRGTDALAALSWLFRHSKMPWAARLVARVRVILRHDGLTCGSRVIDDTANHRAKSAHTRAPLYTLRDQESGGSIWGPRLRLLRVVTPAITLPVGLTC